MRRLWEIIRAELVRWIGERFPAPETPVCAKCGKRDHHTGVYKTT